MQKKQQLANSEKGKISWITDVERKRTAMM